MCDLKGVEAEDLLTFVKSGAYDAYIRYCQQQDNFKNCSDFVNTLAPDFVIKYCDIFPWHMLNYSYQYRHSISYILNAIIDKLDSHIVTQLLSLTLEILPDSYVSNWVVNKQVSWSQLLQYSMVSEALLDTFWEDIVTDNTVNCLTVCKRQPISLQFYMKHKADLKLSIIKSNPYYTANWSKLDKLKVDLLQ